MYKNTYQLLILIKYLLMRQTNLENQKLKKKYHTFGTHPNSNRQIVEKCQIDISNKQIHDRALSWLGTGTSIKSGGRFMDPNLKA
jgi:hypothetical protein